MNSGERKEKTFGKGILIGVKGSDEDGVDIIKSASLGFASDFVDASTLGANLSTIEQSFKNKTFKRET